ncbi:MFS transporter [Streptomyces laculatispora]|nr:MFS transporter [Streptomyces laculatispora]
MEPAARWLFVGAAVAAPLTPAARCAGPLIERLSDIKGDFHLNSFEQSSIVSVLLIGAMGAGRAADLLGRRKKLAIEGLVFTGGTAILVFAPRYATLLIGRIVLGLAVGAASATVPIHLSEVSPTELRGRFLTLNQLMITIGILISYLVNLAFASSGQWRAMFAVGAIPAGASCGRPSSRRARQRRRG